MELNEVRISSRQFLLTVVMFVTGTSILLVPSGLILAAKEDAWIASIVGMLFSLVLVMLYIKLAKMYPEMSLFELSEAIFGRWLGRAVNVLYIFYAFILASEVLSNLGDFIVAEIMVETPKKYIHLLFLLPVCYGVALGFETITRSMEAIFPTLFFLFFSLLVLMLPESEPSQMMPILGKGWKPILQGALVVVNVPYLELVLLLGVIQYLNSKQKAAKAFLFGTVLGAFTLIIIPLIIILVLGRDFAGIMLYPGFTVAKMVDIGQFLQRIEVVFAAIWICTLFYKLTICFYVSLKGVNHLFGIMDSRTLLFPLTLILWMLSVIVYPNAAIFQATIEAILAYNLLFGLLLPLLMLTVSALKKKKNGQQQTTQGE